MDYSPTFDKAHPTAKSIMNEEFYFSPIDETGPFGSDDGADTYPAFAEWRMDHPGKDPSDFVLGQIEEWGYPTFDLKETSMEKLSLYLKSSDMALRYMIGIDAAINAVAFGQIYLEGSIDQRFKPLAIAALERQLQPEILKMWPEDYQVERKSKLEQMLADVRSLN